MLPVCVFWFVVLGVGLCGRGCVVCRGVVSVGWVCGVLWVVVWGVLGEWLCGLCVVCVGCVVLGCVCDCVVVVGVCGEVVCLPLLWLCLCVSLLWRAACQHVVVCALIVFVYFYEDIIVYFYSCMHSLSVGDPQLFLMIFAGISFIAWF